MRLRMVCGTIRVAILKGWRRCLNGVRTGKRLTLENERLEEDEVHKNEYENSPYLGPELYPVTGTIQEPKSCPFPWGLFAATCSLSLFHTLLPPGIAEYRVVETKSLRERPVTRANPASEKPLSYTEHHRCREGNASTLALQPLARQNRLLQPPRGGSRERPESDENLHGE
jgi:hypothetical protein